MTTLANSISGKTKNFSTHPLPSIKYIILKSSKDEFRGGKTLVCPQINIMNKILNIFRHHNSKELKKYEVAAENVETFHVTKKKQKKHFHFSPFFPSREHEK